MNIFFYIEHLCFNDLCKNLQPNFKNSIDYETEEKIKKKLLNEVNNQNKFYSIKDLAAALRRYISRYLVGNRQDFNIDEKRELYFELTRLDLWDKKYEKLENLEELIQEQIGEFRLKVGQAFSLYEIIGEEDKNYISKMEEQIAEENNTNNPETINNQKEKEDFEELEKPKD